MLRLYLLARLPQHALRSDQAIVKHDPRRVEQVRDQRIPQGVADGRAQLSGGDDIPHSKNSQLLRNERLTELKRQLQFANTSVSSAEELQNAYTYRVSESARKNSALRVWRSGTDRHVTSDILLYYCLCMSTHDCSDRAEIQIAEGDLRRCDTSLARVENRGARMESC